MPLSRVLSPFTVESYCPAHFLHSWDTSHPPTPPIEEQALLDTIPDNSSDKCPKLKYLTVAPMFAEAIERVYHDISISKLWN